MSSLVDVAMECGDDSNRFTNSAGSANRENVCMDGFTRIQGLENEKYGIMNVRMNCIGSNDYMDSNSNRNGRWNPMLSCSEGVFTGLEVRVKSGSENGIINFKALCTNLPKGRKLMSHKAIIKHFFNNCLYIFFIIAYTKQSEENRSPDSPFIMYFREAKIMVFR